MIRDFGGYGGKKKARADFLLGYTVIGEAQETPACTFFGQ